MLKVFYVGIEKARASHIRKESFQRVCGAFALTLQVLGSICVGQELGTPPLGEMAERSPSERAPVKTVATLDRSDRNGVASYYRQFYLPGNGLALGWTGDTSRCIAGSTSETYTRSTLARINFYRVLSGLPGDVVFNSTWNSKCQQAALMMSAQGALSHFPDKNWACYTAAGAEAAGNSNITLGYAGPEAIDCFMDDQGPANGPVGHRRWILYPPQRIMGTGSVPATAGRWPANTLWVLGGGGARPEGPSFVAWPPAGFFPYQLLPKVSARWSFSIPGADFASAKVAMKHAGTNIPVEVQPAVIGFGDNTLVWNPRGVATWATRRDEVYEVTIADVITGGAAKTFNYAVTVFDPDVPAVTAAVGLYAVSLSWPEWADNYDLEQSPTPTLTSSWGRTPDIPQRTNGEYRVTVDMSAENKFFRLRKR